MLKNTALVITLVISFFLLINGIQSMDTLADQFSNQIETHLDAID